jgi:hypothetical protein
MTAQSEPAWKNEFDQVMAAAQMRNKFNSLTYAFDHLSDEFYDVYGCYIEDLFDYFDERLWSTVCNLKAAVEAAKERGD